jgi:hypothetical protein
VVRLLRFVIVSVRRLRDLTMQGAGVQPFTRESGASHDVRHRLHARVFAPWGRRRALAIDQ